METAAKENSSRNTRELMEELIAKANADLRKLKMTMRYRITELEKYDAKKAKATGSDFGVRFVSLQDWQVAPDQWQADLLPGLGNYMSGWTFDTKELDPASVAINKSVFEMKGVPQLFPVARDFCWRGNGKKIGADYAAVFNQFFNTYIIN